MCLYPVLSTLALVRLNICDELVQAEQVVWLVALTVALSSMCQVAKRPHRDRNQ